MLNDLSKDIRFAARMLLKTPAVMLTAILALALGIAANTAIFSVIDAVLLRPLPYPQPERMVELSRKYPEGYGDAISIPKFMAWKRNTAFDGVTAFDQGGPGLNLSYGDHAEQVKGIHVSGDFFKVFGVSPKLGRTFTAAEDVPGGAHVIVISESLWRNRFASDPSIVGRTIPLNGDPHTVVGILPASFHADPRADIWLPLQADPNSNNQAHYLRVVGRLKAGVTLARAQAEAEAMGEQFRRANPEWMDKKESVAVIPLQRAKTGNVRPALLILMGAVGFVLLIACANVANLLLARAATRQKEMAVRSAIGANRWRIIRQLLTESVMLAGIAGVVGLALGILGVRALLSVAPANIPRIEDLSKAPLLSILDWRMLAFTVAVCFLTGILFGIFPALHVARTNLSATLKENSSRGSTGTGHNRTRVVLMVTELALALVLLTGAALLIRTFDALHRVNTGIDSHNVITMETSLSAAKYERTAAVDQLTRDVVQRIESLPQVEAATLTLVAPLTNEIDIPFDIVGKPAPAGNQFNGDEQWRFVSPHYFAVFRIPLLRGRIFDDRDTASATHVVVINDAMAKRYWPKEDPVGQQIVIGKGMGPQFEESPRQIIGIVGNVRETGVNEDQPSGVMYIPSAQVTDALMQFGSKIIPLTWAVRVRQNVNDLTPSIERQFHAVDGQLAAANVSTMDQLIAESISRQNFNMLLLSIFAGIALLLSAVGIFALMSYSVEQRTHEMGIRMALGATDSDMLRLIVFQGMRLAGAGVLIGVIGALGLTRTIKTFLFGVRSTDPLAFVSVALLLSMVVLVASYIPARRATRVDPVIALRYE